jgi:hypothetical protein
MPCTNTFLPTDEPSVRKLGLNEMEGVNIIICQQLYFYLNALTEILS